MLHWQRQGMVAAAEVLPGLLPAQVGGALVQEATLPVWSPSVPALARLTVPLVMLALDKQLPSFLTTMFLWELTALCMIMAPSRVHSLPVLVATLVHHVCKHSAQQKMSELPMVHSVSDLPRL